MSAPRGDGEIVAPHRDSARCENGPGRQQRWGGGGPRREKEEEEEGLLAPLDDPLLLGHEERVSDRVERHLARLPDDRERNVDDREVLRGDGPARLGREELAARRLLAARVELVVRLRSLARQQSDRRAVEEEVHARKRLADKRGVRPVAPAGARPAARQLHRYGRQLEAVRQPRPRVDRLLLAAKALRVEERQVLHDRVVDPPDLEHHLQVHEQRGQLAQRRAERVARREEARCEHEHDRVLAKHGDVPQVQRYPVSVEERERKGEGAAAERSGTLGVALDLAVLAEAASHCVVLSYYGCVDTGTVCLSLLRASQSLAPA
eukprot:506298-Prymnesium_polylepis.1